MKNKPLLIIVLFLVISILIAIYFQFILVQRIYLDKKQEIDYNFIEDLEHAFYLTEQNKKSTVFSHENYHIIINSYVLKSTDESYEMNNKEFEEFIETINNNNNNNKFNLVEGDFTDIKHYLNSIIEDNKHEIEYEIEYFNTISYKRYQKIRNSSSLIISYQFGTFIINFKNENSLLLSGMIKIVSSSLFSILSIIFCGILLIKRYLNEKKLSIYKNEFINNLTHELQTPLTVSKLALEKLTIDLRKENKNNRYVTIIEKENNKIEKLAKRILKLAELKTIIPVKEKINVSKSIQDIVNRYQSLLDKEDMLLTDLHHLELKLNGNKDRFLDLLDNLLSNAVKYSVSPRTIVLKTSLKNGKLYLRVKDNGIGIPKEFEDKIFTPFFKVPKNNTHEIKSHGLGLSYVVEIVKEMKGTISISTELNKGTIFNITLPYEN